VGETRCSTVEGHVYRAGARSTRCFHDIRNQFSEADALATALRAISLMPEVEKIFPDAPRPQLKQEEEPVVSRRSFSLAV
jgi:hypothetical protein